MASKMYIVMHNKAQLLHLRYGRLCYKIDDKDVWYVEGLDVPIYTEAEMIAKYPELMI